jgi:hypothetical protein
MEALLGMRNLSLLNVTNDSIGIGWEIILKMVPGIT